MRHEKVNLDQVDGSEALSDSYWRIPMFGVAGTTREDTMCPCVHALRFVRHMRYMHEVK